MPKETNKNKSKDKKHFMKDFKAELKKVIWPTPKQLVNNTVAVITVVLITAVIVLVLDFAFEKMNEYGIEKIKTLVETHNTVENASTNESNEVNNAESNNEVLENTVNE